jgi:hypothetical protein
MSRILCALYCNFDAIYSAQQPVRAMCIVVPTIYNVVTSARIQSSVFNWTCLRWYWRYVDNAMRVTLQTWWKIQRTPTSLRYLDCGPGHIQCKYSSTYLSFNSLLNVSPPLLEIYRQFNVRYTANMVRNTEHILQLSLCDPWSRDMQCNYSSAYSGLNIQLNVSVLPLEISRPFNAHYTAILVPNTAHILQITLCELWSRTYTMHLQLHIFRLQYSFERICSAIGDISTIQCALYCKLGAKYSAHAPVYTMWTVVPAIYKVFSAPHI